MFRHLFALTLLAFLLPLTAVSQKADLPVYLDKTKSIEQRVEDALSRMTLDEKIRVIHAQSKFSSRGVPRLGIPDFWADDGPHGVRPDVKWDDWDQAGQTNDSCVAFPALTCLAATWNPSVAYMYGKSLGEEALYRGKNMMLGPGVNILRNPLCGRNFEYMGEDPWLTSQICVPYIQGVQSNGVSVCVKHFCLNNDEDNRHHVNVIVSDRALHEIYLPAFRAAVQQGHAWAVMASYNLYRGYHNCQNPYLLNGILKGDWQFDGAAVSDWDGTHNTEQAVLNGLDMEFCTTTSPYSKNYLNHYDGYFMGYPYKERIMKGEFTTKELDEKVRRVLRLFFRTSMAEHQNHGFLCSPEHYAAALQIGEEGIVLLKNDGNLLPINTEKKPTILVVGENAIKMMTVGGGSSSLKAQREISPLQGLKQRLQGRATVEYERGYVGDTGGEYNGVTTGQDLGEKRSDKQMISDAVEKARKADYVIIFGGLNKSDHQDAEGCDRKAYDLPYGQDRLVEALAKANPNTVFVNISGNPVPMVWKDKVPAILQGWYLGSQAGEALAAVLCGDANPSGKLPFTWPAALKDVGAFALNTYPGTWRQDPEPEGSLNAGEKIIDEEYKEGVYVGYRWADAHKTKPLFAFGHGLSYTTFDFSNLRLSANEIGESDSLTVTVTVKNTGAREGKEVVQLYIHDDEASVDRPYKELKGFQKVSLQPGQSKDVSITIGKDALSFWDEAVGNWKAEKGTFTVLIGNASDNLPLSKAFTLK